MQNIIWRWRGGGEAMVRTKKKYQWLNEAQNIAATSNEMRKITRRDMCRTLGEEGILGGRERRIGWGDMLSREGEWEMT